MESDTLAIMAFTGLVASGWAALLWARLNRIEDRLDALVAQSARREEVAALGTGVREEVAAVSTGIRKELVELRTEVREEFAEFRAEFRAELTSVRSEMLIQTGSAAGAKLKAPSTSTAILPENARSAEQRI